MDFETRFSERLKEALKISGKAQAQLSREVGLSESVISQYLSGDRMPRISGVFAMAKCLDVNPQWLMGMDSVPDLDTLLQMYGLMDSEEQARLRFYATMLLTARKNETGDSSENDAHR